MNNLYVKNVLVKTVLLTQRCLPRPFTVQALRWAVLPHGPNSSLARKVAYRKPVPRCFLPLLKCPMLSFLGCATERGLVPYFVSGPLSRKGMLIGFIGALVQQPRERLYFRAQVFSDG